MQWILGLLADSDVDKRAAGQTPTFNINPRKIAVDGGSYGGFLTFAMLTDPTWKSPEHHRKMRIAAAVPRFTGSDILESLAPSGHYFDLDPKTGRPAVATTDPKEALSRRPLGVIKDSILTGFYSYQARFDSEHVVFPSWIHNGYARAQAGEPYDGDATMEDLADRLLERSAYFQASWWKRVEKGLRIPIFFSGTTTDVLFSAIESTRFYNKLKSIDKTYPTAMYFGDYDHGYAQNKAKEYGDICGGDRHVCTVADFKSLKLTRPTGRIHRGLTARINKFLDYYLQGRGKKPGLSVAASTTICAGVNDSKSFPADEPGITLQARNWRALHRNVVPFRWEGGGAAVTTTSNSAPDAHSADSDPVARSRNASIPRCYTPVDNNPGAGVVQYTSDAILAPFTLVGMPDLQLVYTATGNDYWIGARLFDLFPDGTMTLVTRGVCRVNKDAYAGVDCRRFELFGSAWRFEKDHKVVLELTQSDTPFLRKDNLPSSISYTSASLRLPAAPDTLIKDPRF
jgi:hypothetical protein